MPFDYKVYSRLVRSFRRRARRTRPTGPVASGDAPTVSSLDVVSGAGSGGTTVVVTGTNFEEPGANILVILFGGVPARGVSVTSDTTATCITPAGSGVVAVRVTNSNGTDELLAAYTYFAAPTITSTTPASGPAAGSTEIVLAGTGYADNSPGTNVVTIDGNACTSVVVDSDIQITCDTPAGTAGGNFDVVVTNDNGVGTDALGFTYFAAPTLTGLSLSSGPAIGGRPLTLTGTGFTANSAGTNTVTINGNACTSVAAVNDTTITCDTPAGTENTGPFDVVVTNNNGSGTLAGSYSYNAPPTVTGVSPAEGTSLGGTAITVTGTGFATDGSSTNTVRVGGVACFFNVTVNDTTITCTTPAGSQSAVVDVTVTNLSGVGTGASLWTYHPSPTVGLVTPDTGSQAGGDAVTITGTGFTVNSAGTNTVTFDGVTATSVVTVGDSTITCVTPAGAFSPDVVVTNNNGSGTGSGVFTYDSLPSQLNPIAAIVAARASRWSGVGPGVYRRRY